MDLLARLAADGLLDDGDGDGGDGIGAGGSSSARTVVLVGVTGDGKSSTGNTLCNSEVFEVSAGMRSATQECDYADYRRPGTAYPCWRVVDTVGLHDTDLSQQEVMTRFSAFSDRTPDGIDAFIFVVRWGRFKPEHDAAMTAFVANCGEAVLQHTMLVFTHCRETPEALQRALVDSAPASLRAWVSKLRCEAIPIDNPSAWDGLATDSAAREALHHGLDILLEQNGGLRYSNEALAEARAQIKSAEEEQRAAFAVAVADWRKGSGPVVIERDDGVVTRPAGDYREAVDVTEPILAGACGGDASSGAGVAVAPYEDGNSRTHSAT